jgi:anti-sigma factor RsiW
LSYLDGQLAEDSQQQVQAHLEGCKPCSEELAAMRAIARALQQGSRESLTANALADRYGCPGPRELTSQEAGQADEQTEERDWIVRHLEACPRCQREIDLIRLMGMETSEASSPVVPQDLSARVEERLMARVRQGRGADRRAPFMALPAAVSSRVLLRAALGIGLAAVVAVSGILYLKRGPTLIAQRPSEQQARDFQSPLPTHPISSPSVVARSEPSRIAPLPSATSPGAVRESEAPAASVTRPSLPPLVPAKQGEALTVLILPTPTRPGLRSAVAAGLQDELGTVLPPERDFPAEQSVDDLTANRHLGRLFGVRYVLEIDVKDTPSGYLVVLRAADTETGGVVASRERHAAEEAALGPIAGQLAKELQEELRARP